MRAGVPVTVAVIIGVAAGLASRPGAQELRVACDADRDGAITAAGSPGCAEQRADRARGNADGRAEARTADADGLRQQFGQADQDGDGRISRDEWLQWFGPAYAGSEERMAGTD